MEVASMPFNVQLTGLLRTRLARNFISLSFTTRKSQKWVSLGRKESNLHQNRLKRGPFCMAEPSEPNDGEQLHILEPVPPILSRSAASLIRDFYACINDTTQDQSDIEKFLAEECCFEDLAFPHQFKGRKEISAFYKRLKEAMGNNIRFKIETGHQGYSSTITEQPTAIVMWHLEWNQLPIPFTKGCTFYQCSGDEKSLLIKNALVFVESPLKPGDMALDLLKITSTLFQKFPVLAEKILKDPHTVIIFIVKIYKLFIEPFMLPLMVYYSNLWTFAAGVLSYMLNILQNIWKSSA